VKRSHLLFILMTVLLALVSVPKIIAQANEAEVEGLKTEALSSHFWRLTWKTVPLKACGERVSYSVYRANNDHFRRSSENQLASGITATTFIARVPDTSQSYHYQVIAVKVPQECGKAEDPKAQFYLGEAYYYGKVFPQDFSQAAVYYRKAAEQGYPEAEASLGYLYHHGRGVPQNDLESALWYQKASIQGDSSAQAELAHMYLYGIGVTRDSKQAAAWYMKAAEQGDALGQCNLGVLYYEGEGVPQDYSESFEWYRIAASQGFPEAMFNLGEMYSAGKGVSQDYDEAYFWMEAWFSMNSKDAEQMNRAVLLADRDAVASHLTKGTLIQIQRRVNKWLNDHSSGSDPRKQEGSQ
jgi:TPR repeat protein